ncbi:protein-disulfide isomerase [Frateuria sp. Soil773]|uniref:thiol:disulfide interchange protein DsbA/DsbL n=1 Tax=Frateuria sp. Soil773 TaxID=1736407 RepID=UPI0006F49AC9|nr:thiol:disulfide interchange protein DsbA/DsbL [Frateuria sp. Soil773]KRF01967.1 protein-disulfide isomerase [Frateuria sp. Soil773]
MLKRLPILCAALLALAACSNNSDTGSAAQQAETAPPATAASATAPAAAGTATTEPAPAPASAGTAADATAPAPAQTAAATPAAAADAQPFVDDGKWVEGKDYQRIEPAQPKVSGTDKIEVVEVFSYGCPACNQFHPVVSQLAKSLPASAQMVYLPASFIPQENWPTLQRAYLTAQVLGVADKANDAMYDAVWKSQEISAMKPTGGLKPKAALPTIDDIAKVYAKFGADPKEFAAVANSFSINTKMKRSDELVKAYGVDGTPTIVIDGKYRFAPTEVGYGRSIELAQWLVAKEAAGK